MAIFKGIDVSYSQGTIDWNKVKSSGINFAMIRLGRHSQSGDIALDTKFKENAEKALTAGMDIGVYFYGRAVSVEEAKKEANFVLEALAEYAGKFTYPIAYDMETDYTYFAKQTKDLNTKIAKAFLDTIESAGYYSMLYTYKSFAEIYLNMKDLSAYDFWLAHVGNNGATKDPTNYTGPYGIWQYSWVGKVNGISGDVDLNYAYKDYASIIKATGLNNPLGTKEDTSQRLADLEDAISKIKAIVNNL